MEKDKETESTRGDSTKSDNMETSIGNDQFDNDEEQIGEMENENESVLGSNKNGKSTEDDWETEKLSGRIDNKNRKSTSSDGGLSTTTIGGGKSETEMQPLPKGRPKVQKKIDAKRKTELELKRLAITDGFDSKKFNGDAAGADFTCVECGETFIYECQLQSHEVYGHNFDTTVRSTSSDSSSIVCYRCNICSRIDTSLSAYLMHFRGGGNGKGRCIDKERNRLKTYDSCVCLICGYATMRNQMNSHLHAHDKTIGKLSTAAAASNVSSTSTGKSSMDKSPNESNILACPMCISDSVTVPTVVDLLLHVSTWHPTAITLSRELPTADRDGETSARPKARGRPRKLVNALAAQPKKVVVSNNYARSGRKSKRIVKKKKNGGKNLSTTTESGGSVKTRRCIRCRLNILDEEYADHRRLCAAQVEAKWIKKKQPHVGKNRTVVAKHQQRRRGVRRKYLTSKKSDKKRQEEREEDSEEEDDGNYLNLDHLNRPSSASTDYEDDDEEDKVEPPAPPQKQSKLHGTPRARKSSVRRTSSMIKIPSRYSPSDYVSSKKKRGRRVAANESPTSTTRHAEQSSINRGEERSDSMNGQSWPGIQRIYPLDATASTSSTPNSSIPTNGRRRKTDATYSCGKCQKAFVDDPLSYLVHTVNRFCHGDHGFFESQASYCPLCEESHRVKSPPSLLEHVRLTHFGRNLDLSEVASELIGYVRVCEECGRGFHRTDGEDCENSTKGHQPSKVPVEKIVACRLCHNRFKSDVQLRLHLWTMHLMDKYEIEDTLAAAASDRAFAGAASSSSAAGSSSTKNVVKEANGDESWTVGTLARLPIIPKQLASNVCAAVVKERSEEHNRRPRTNFTCLQCNTKYASVSTWMTHKEEFHGRARANDAEFQAVAQGFFGGQRWQMPYTRILGGNNRIPTEMLVSSDVRLLSRLPPRMLNINSSYNRALLPKLGPPPLVRCPLIGDEASRSTAGIGPSTVGNQQQSIGGLSSGMRPRIEAVFSLGSGTSSDTMGRQWSGNGSSTGMESPSMITATSTATGHQPVPEGARKRTASREVINLEDDDVLMLDGGTKTASGTKSIVRLASENVGPTARKVAKLGRGPNDDDGSTSAAYPNIYASNNESGGLPREPGSSIEIMDSGVLPSAAASGVARHRLLLPATTATGGTDGRAATGGVTNRSQIVGTTPSSSGLFAMPVSLRMGAPASSGSSSWMLRMVTPAGSVASPQFRIVPNHPPPPTQMGQWSRGRPILPQPSAAHPTMSGYSNSMSPRHSNQSNVLSTPVVAQNHSSFLPPPLTTGPQGITINTGFGRPPFLMRAMMPGGSTTPVTVQTPPPRIPSMGGQPIRARLIRPAPPSSMTHDRYATVNSPATTIQITSAGVRVIPVSSTNQSTTTTTSVVPGISISGGTDRSN